MTLKRKVLDEAVAEARAFCTANADAGQAARYQRFFNEGYDPYGVPKEIWEANHFRLYEHYRDRFGMADFLDLGDALFQSGKYEEGSFAVTTLIPMKDQLTAEVFQRIGRWL